MKLVVLGNFLTQRPTGVQRFAIEVSSALSGLLGDDCILVHPPGATIPHKLIGATRDVANFAFKRNRSLSWSQIDAPIHLQRFYSQFPVWNPSNVGSPFVRNQHLTLHDCAVLSQPKCFSAMFRAKALLSMRLTLPRVKSVSTVSHAMKSEILRYFPFLSGKIDVVPNAPAIEFSPQMSETINRVVTKYKLCQPFCFMIGSIDPRKNMQRVIDGFIKSGLNTQGMQLVLAGAEFKTFASVNLDTDHPSVVRIGYVDDRDLPALYAAATMTIMGSVYEGFGLPVVESLACGTRVACSDIPVFREVSQGEAFFFDPYSVESIASSLYDCARAKPQALQYQKVASRYSWEKSALALLDSIARNT